MRDLLLYIVTHTLTHNRKATGGFSGLFSKPNRHIPSHAAPIRPEITLFFLQGDFGTKRPCVQVTSLGPVKTLGNRRNTRNHSVNLRMIARIPNFIHSSPGKTDQWRTPISSFFLTCLANKTPVLSCRSQDRPPDSSRFFAWFFQN